MAEFDAEKLRERLERLNREQLARIEKLAEELLAEARRTDSFTKRSDQRRLSPRAG